MKFRGLQHPPTFLTFIGGVDWGYVNEGCILRVGLSNRQQFFVTDEVYEKEKKLNWWIDQMRQFARSGVKMFFADPSQPAFIDEADESLSKLGCRVYSGVNDVYAGIMFISTLLQIDLESRQPSLMVNRRCGHLIQEMNSYRWAELRGTTTLTEEPAPRQRDHACDALRYGIYTYALQNVSVFSKFTLILTGR